MSWIFFITSSKWRIMLLTSQEWSFAYSKIFDAGRVHNSECVRKLSTRVGLDPNSKLEGLGLSKQSASGGCISIQLQRVVIKNTRKLNKSISSRVVILKASRSIDEGGESSATTAKVSLKFGACKSSKRLTMILIIFRLIRRALDIRRH